MVAKLMFKYYHNYEYYASNFEYYNSTISSRHKLLVARHIVATDDDLYMQNVLQK
jgi:hypothetical protein